MIMLKEIGHDFSLHPINIWQGDQKQPDYLAINPVGKVPAIVDEGQVYTESNAILMYLSVKANWGAQAGDPQYQEIIASLFYQASTVGPYWGQVEFWTRIAKEKNPQALAHYRTIVSRTLEVLEHSLEDQPFLAGETYSIADIAHYSWIRKHDHLGFSLDGFPKLKAWKDNLSARPAVIEAQNELEALPK